MAAARVKFQQPQGMHGSFWMNASGEPEGSRAVEIDAVEFFGKGYRRAASRSSCTTRAARSVASSRAPTTCSSASDNWWKKYHVFSVVWTPSGYSFRIDGHETFRTTKARSDKQVLPS